MKSRALDPLGTETLVVKISTSLTLVDMAFHSLGFLFWSGERGIVPLVFRGVSKISGGNNGQYYSGTTNGIAVYDSNRVGGATALLQSQAVAC